jgi:hypothetical protein
VAVRISLLDHSGCGLGLAIGLVQLGHRVRYIGQEPWPGDTHGEIDEMQRQLLARFCGGGAAAPDPADDLLVIMSSFADELQALHAGRYTGERVALDAPLRRSLNPLVYPVRLQQWFELAMAARQVVAIDCSDTRLLRETGFEQLRHCTTLAREVGCAEATAWRPLPFLYNPVLLWLEMLRPEREWLLPAAERRAQWDWAFCGTLQHARYGDRRARLVAELQQRWPALRGVVSTTAPFASVLKVLHSVRCGLDLPGEGELCFRLHEYLALGVPVLRPWPFGIAMPAGVERAIVTDPAALGELDLQAVRAIYQQSYAPRVAAETMLAAAHDDALARC